MIYKDINKIFVYAHIYIYIYICVHKYMNKDKTQETLLI